MITIDKNVWDMFEEFGSNEIECLDHAPESVWHYMAVASVASTIRFASLWDSERNEFVTFVIAKPRRGMDGNDRFIAGWVSASHNEETFITRRIENDDVPTAVNRVVEIVRKRRRKQIDTEVHAGWFMGFLLIGLIAFTYLTCSVAVNHSGDTAWMTTAFVAGTAAFLALPYGGSGLMRKLRSERLWKRDWVCRVLTAIETAYQPASAPA